MLAEAIYLYQKYKSIIGMSYRQLVGLEDQLKKIDHFAEEAQERIDNESAHNKEVLMGIRIVETFLKRTGRICYGGTAMNSHLPDKYKFYDPNADIPDYDFLTTDGEADLESIEQDLRREGFTEIGRRPGIHAGTMKLYLNYVPIADVTEINKELYNMFKKKAKVIKGITYMDINSLRMMMYLELSRPAGEVERWKKVYERLLLLQYVAKPARCKQKDLQDLKVAKPIYTAALNYAINYNRVLAGTSVLHLYEKSEHSKVSGDYLRSANLPIIFYTPTLNLDGEAMEILLGTADTKVKFLDPVGEFVPRMAIVTYLKKPILLMVEETACHSYNVVHTQAGRNIRIASLDLMITLYFSLQFSKDKVISKFFPMKLHCMAQAAIDTSNFLRRFPKKSQFPFISLECSGHQKGFPSLLREKFERVAEEKKRRLAGTAKRSSSKTARKTSRKTLKKSLPSSIKTSLKTLNI